MNTQLTQDEIYSLLKQYLGKKSVMTASEVERPGWDHDHEVVYKGFCRFGLGVVPPIMVPTSMDTMPRQLMEDPVWMEILGVEPEDTGTEDSSGEPPQPVASGADSHEKKDPGSPDPTKVKVAENGDLSFVLKTGVHQPKIPTEVESLATEVKEITDKVADDISTGEVVTKEGMTADRTEEMSEDEPDVPPENVDETEDQSDEADEDLDDLDKLE